MLHRFDSVYAPHLGGTAKCAERYNALCVSSHELSLEEANVLGEGAFGRVFGGELYPRAAPKAQPRAAWRALRISPNTKEDSFQGDGAPPRGLPVAIKVAQTTDDSALAQLLLEARLLANMDNPHIARVWRSKTNTCRCNSRWNYAALGTCGTFCEKEASPC